MRDFKIFLDLLIVQITYSYGHLYWDRCGQTLSDIETQCDGWFPMRDQNNIGRMENPEKGMTLVFNEKAFNLNIEMPGKLESDLLIQEVQKAWKIISANFGLEEYNTLACRFHFLKPTTSVDESEQLIKNSEFNVVIPERLKAPNYDLNIRQVTTVFKKEDTEYRVELKGITRSRAVDATVLHKQRPETLSTDQKKYRLAKLKQFSAYSTDPMYAVMLDIDCINYSSEQVSVGTYIKAQTAVARNDFLPILERL